MREATVHSFNPETERHAEDFKTHCLQIATDLTITRQEIADVTGYNHSTISRWFSSGDLHFPAFLVPLLNTERLLPLAKAMLEFQGNGLGFILTRFSCSAARLNHSIEDEAAEIVVCLGKAIDTARKNPTQKGRMINSLDSIIDAARRAKLEVENLK
jgi:hypothetical protein